MDYHATEGRSWRLRLSGHGARIARLPASGEDPDAADASARGTANELVLAFYGRIPVDSLKLDGDRRTFDQLTAWDPDA
jgi:MDMPI C-terminal domain